MSQFKGYNMGKFIEIQGTEKEVIKKLSQYMPEKHAKHFLVHIEEYKCFLLEEETIWVEESVDLKTIPKPVMDVMETERYSHEKHFSGRNFPTRREGVSCRGRRAHYTPMAEVAKATAKKSIEGPEYTIGKVIKVKKYFIKVYPTFFIVIYGILTKNSSATGWLELIKLLFELNPIEEMQEAEAERCFWDRVQKGMKLPSSSEDCSYVETSCKYCKDGKCIMTKEDEEKKLSDLSKRKIIKRRV